MVTATPDDAGRQAGLLGRIAFAQFTRGNVVGARVNFREALLKSRSASGSPGSDLARLCQSFLRDPHACWALDTEWKRFAEDWSTEEWLKAELASARRGLLAYLDQFYHLSEEPDGGSLIPVVIPIALEIGQALVPEDTSATGPLLGTYIPEFRDRIRAESGVTVPGVRVRSRDAEDTSYTILIEEIAVAAGSVPIGKLYTPTPLSVLLDRGIPGTGLSPDSQHVTDVPGCWVDAAHWNTVRDAGLALWQPVHTAILHLEGVVRRNLTAFYGVQEAQTTLDSWKHDTAGDSDIDAALSHLPTRLRLMRVLRSLVADRVPITAGAKILRAIIGPDKEHRTGDEIIRAVRQQCKDLLPGNEATATRIRLDGHWEQQLAAHVVRTGDTSTLEVPPVEAHRLIGDVRHVLHGASAQPVLVTASSELRPLIERFLQRDFPDLIVLAEDELISFDESSARLSQWRTPGETATAS